MRAVTRCIQCDTILKGRSDKKFCNDYCRNIYNNQKNGHIYNYIKHINVILKRNRAILQKIYQHTTPETIIPLQMILQLGFHLHFYTHHIPNANAYFCYDYGYELLPGHTDIRIIYVQSFLS